jgi:small conductance mechanosensitive channel
MVVLVSQTDLNGACGVEPSWVCEAMFDLSNGNRVAAVIADAVFHIVLILAIAALATWFARRYFSRAVARLVAPDRAAAAKALAVIGDKTPSFVPDPSPLAPVPDPRYAARVASITTVVGSTAAVIIWTIAGITILGELGVDLAPLIAGAGIAGIALGFGAQSLVKDCISGLFMLIEDQYGIGDVVDLDEAVGTVEKISLRVTVLRGIDGTAWYVPNGVVQRVGNRSQLYSVAIVDVNVGYDADLTVARSTIIDCVRRVCASDEWSPSVEGEPQLLGVEALSADGVTIRVTITTAPGQQWALQRVLREEIKAALDGAGIEIPFLHRSVALGADARRSAPDDGRTGSR